MKEPLSILQVFDCLRARLGEGKVLEMVEKGVKGYVQPHVVVEAGAVAEVAKVLATDPALGFDYLDSISGVDHPPDRIALVYHASALARRSSIQVKAFVPRADPRLPTVVPVWPGANWHERETFDLLGVVFEGHPDLRRILLPLDWVGHPLRKDYETSKTYQSIDNTRPPDA